MLLSQLTPHPPPNMRTASPRRRMDRPGLTLLELTVVLAVLLAMTTVLMIGARAWSRGSDRSACIMNIRNVQMSVRSYQNLYGFSAGTMPRAERGTQSIADHLLHKGYIDDSIHEMLKGTSTCPGGGLYELNREDVFPTPGELYLRCSLEAKQQHLLPGDRDW